MFRSGPSLSAISARPEGKKNKLKQKPQKPDLRFAANPLAKQQKNEAGPRHAGEVVLGKVPTPPDGQNTAKVDQRHVAGKLDRRKEFLGNPATG